MNNVNVLRLPTITLLLLFILFIPFTTSIQPTQQYNKIYLNPFYRQSLTSNTNYTYTINVNPPDGISKVNTAIISFNAQINGQTQNITLKVNGKSCNNPDYYIATSFSTTGTTQFYYDCSNIITIPGNYTIVINSAVNTGTIQGWLDLTYMNNPIGELNIMGTEYSPGDPATMFVQLKNSQGLPVSNGSCYLDVYYPLNASNIHPYTIRDSPMIQASGDDGLYYYDMITPSQLGVYMLSSKCSYSYNFIWLYPYDELVYKPNATYIAGTWSGDTLSLNNPYDNNYLQCDVAGLNVGCSAIFIFNTSVYGNITNVTNINIYYSASYKGSSSVTWTTSMSYFNGSSYVSLPSTLILVHQANAPYGSYQQFFSNTIPSNAIINNTVTILLNSTGGSGTASSIWTNWLSLSVLSSSGTIQDVKGSSEMHVTNIANTTASLSSINYTLLGLNVWNSTIRNLTFYPNVTVNTTVVNVQNITLNLTTQNVTVLNYTVNVTTQTVNVNNLTENVTLISQTVWNYTNRSLTYYQNFTTSQVDLTNYTLIKNNQYNYTDNFNTINNTILSVNQTLMNQLSYVNTSILTSLNNILVNLTSQFNNMINYILNVPGNVWNYTTRNLTYYTNPIINTTIVNVQNVTINITTQNVTVLNQTVNITTQYVNVNNISINTTDIVDNVWNYTARYTHGVILN